MSDAPSTAPQPTPAEATPVSPEMAAPAGPRHTFTPECAALLPIASLSEADAMEAFERRNDAMIVPSVPMHLYALRWLESGDAIYTSVEITRMEWRVDRSVPADLTIRMALRLRPSLPAGPISPAMPIDVVWTRIADSFGLPVACHKKTGAFLRYTGRWDGKPPHVEGGDGDHVVLDGGFERSGDSVKYVWALSTNKYQAWLAEGASSAPAAADEGQAWPRIVFARMQPPKLRRQVAVRADIGDATVRLVCSRCAIVDINDPPHFDPTMKCLHVFGAEILDDDIPRQLQGKEYVIPLHFVTDIRPGPNTFLAGEHAPQRSAVLPNNYRPGNRMSLKMVERQLAELAAT